MSPPVATDYPKQRERNTSRDQVTKKINQVNCCPDFEKALCFHRIVDLMMAEAIRTVFQILSDVEKGLLILKSA
jgi:hypothetical protein